jgi:hypothetical protein
MDDSRMRGNICIENIEESSRKSKISCGLPLARELDSKYLDMRLARNNTHVIHFQSSLGLVVALTQGNWTLNT